MDSQTLLEAVAEAFVTTGAQTPPWPDPHPGGEEPLDEEYSRCLDPGKYRILRSRAEAWARALAGFGLAVVEEVATPAGAWRDRPPSTDFDRAMRLRPLRARAIPLLLGFTAVEDVPDTGVQIGAGEPAVLLESLPDCGCDACDSGSAALLEQFDEYVLAVVTGELIYVGRNQDTLVSTGSGWAASGRFAGSRRLPRMYRDRAGGLWDADAGAGPAAGVREVHAAAEGAADGPESLLRDARAGRLRRHPVVRGDAWW